MTLGEKLAKARKENNITQEQLADRLGVSRQAVSKWESDVAYPETDKLIRISELFDCSLDYLLKDIAEEKPDGTRSVERAASPVAFSLSNIFDYEYKSKKTVGGVPLVHICIGKTAKGIIAIGFRSVGVVSIGLLPIGLLSFGLLALGFIGIGVFFGIGFFGFGAFALGLLSGGAISVGIVSFGAVSFGVMSCGAVAIGQFAVGALAKGHYFAFGDNAAAMVAIGATKAEGTLYTYFTGVQNSFSGYDAHAVLSILESTVPTALKWLMKIALAIAGVS